MKKMTCKRCGWSWQSRAALPKACPKCKSYEWRTYPKKQKKEVAA